MPKKESITSPSEAPDSQEPKESQEDEVFAQIEQINQGMRVEDRGLPEDYMTNDEIDDCIETLRRAVQEKDPRGIHSALSGLDLLLHDTREELGDDYLPESFDTDIDALLGEAEKAYGGPIEFEGDPKEGIKQLQRDMAEMQGNAYGRLSEKVVASIKKIDFFKKHPKFGKVAAVLGVTGLAVFALGSKGLVPEAEAGDDFDAEDEGPEEGRGFPIRVELGADVDTEASEKLEVKDAFSDLELRHKDSPYQEGYIDAMKHFSKKFDEAFYNKQDGSYHFEAGEGSGHRFVICGEKGGGPWEGNEGIDAAQYYNPETNSYIVPKDSVGSLRQYFISRCDGKQYVREREADSLEDRQETGESTDEEVKELLVSKQTFEKLKDNPFYEDLKIEQARDAKYHVIRALDEAGDAETAKQAERNFIDYLKGQEAANLPESQKILMLQYFGDILAENYNEEMLDLNKEALRGEIPLSEFIESAAHYLRTGEKMPVGVCRHINTRLATIGQKILGLDTFATGVLQGSPHITAGFKSKETGNIMFLDYDHIIDSGTADFQKAQAVYERMHVGIIAAGSPVSNAEGKRLTSIQSRAGKDIYEAGQLKHPEESVEKNLINGEILHEKGLDIIITPEKQQIKLDNDKLVLAYTHFDRNSDPYNSLAQLHSLSVGRRFGGSHKELSLGTAIFQKQIKDLGTGVVNDPEILARIGGQYADRKDLSENWSLGFAAAAEASAIYNLKSAKPSAVGTIDAFSSVDLRTSHGARLNYYDPESPLQFHIGAKQNIDFAPSNIQGVIEITPQIASTKLEVGAKTDIAGKAEVDISGEFNKTDYGKVIAAQAEIKAGNFSVSGEYRKTDSDLFFVPNNEHGKLAITKENVPFLDKAKGALTIFGAIDKEDFGGPMGKEANKEFGVKAIITFE